MNKRNRHFEDHLIIKDVMWYRSLRCIIYMGSSITSHPWWWGPRWSSKRQFLLFIWHGWLPEKIWVNPVANKASDHRRKSVPLPPRRRQGRKEVLLLLRDLGTRWGWVVSVSPWWRFTTGTHWIRGWVGLRAVLDTEATGNILCFCWGSNPFYSL
jgi:hypothetical protein